VLSQGDHYYDAAVILTATTGMAEEFRLN